MVAAYETRLFMPPHQGTIAILLPRTDVNQRQEIAQALDAALQPHVKSMALTANLGGSSLADQWQCLLETAEQALQPLDPPSPPTNFQAWPL